MDHLIETFEFENSLDWLGEDDSDHYDSAGEAFDTDIEAWARQALASNGFGDY